DSAAAPPNRKTAPSNKARRSSFELVTGSDTMGYPSPGYRPVALELDAECVHRFTLARKNDKRNGGNSLPADVKWAVSPRWRSRPVPVAAARMRWARPKAS